MEFYSSRKSEKERKREGEWKLKPVKLVLTRTVCDCISNDSQLWDETLTERNFSAGSKLKVPEC